MDMETKQFDPEEGIPIQKDDTAVVLRPNFTKEGEWDTTVHVNAVMMPTEKLNDDQKKAYLSRIPMMRFGNPKDVANLAYFLSTDDSAYITGQNLHINGGMLMV